MDVSIYDANGRQKFRNEIPQSSGRYVDNGIVVYTTSNTSASLALSAISTDMITPLTVTGDGVNGMILEATGFGPYQSAGTVSNFQGVICDTTLATGNIIAAGQFYNATNTVGFTAGQFSIKAYVPPFFGTKTFRYGYQAGATSQTIVNQASATAPTIFTAQWATPTNITGVGSAPAIQWFSPAYNSGWSDYAAPYGPVKYGKTADGTVFIKGTAVSTGVGGTAFVLPAGFRPSQTLIFRCDQNAAWVRYDLDASGNFFQNAGAAAPYVSFAGVTFMAEQ